MPQRLTVALAVLALVGACAAGLVGCATPSQPAAAAAPQAADDPLLTTEHPVMVIDDGSGAVLCLGAVLESLPPQCSGGPSLVGWNWSKLDGQFEHVSGVRWGDFIVTGSFDAEANSFTPTEVVSGAGYEWPASSFDLSTPCPEPAGGWRVIDEATTTPEAQDAAAAVAARLDGYATAWVDQSLNPAAHPDVKATMSVEEQMQAMNDPRLTIFNVTVTRDIAGAEAAIREVWGGMLCVSQAEHSEAQLQVIQDQILATNDELSVGLDGISGVVMVSVIWDEGSLQSEYDAMYGAGLVRVSTALVAAG